MARILGILSAVAIGSAVIALPGQAQSRESVSLTHTVRVTVPSLVKVRVSSLAASTAELSSKAPMRSGSEGLSLTVTASQPWVVAVGPRLGITTQKSQPQSAIDGRSRFSVLWSDVKANQRGEPVMLTLTAP